MSNHVLLEIGIEELPARFIDQAEQQLVDKTTKWLQDLHIDFDTIQSFSTPRRLAILIKEIAENQTTITEEVRGPQTKIATDDSGNWTKAAIGFSKGQGKNPDDLYVKEVKGTEYIFVEKITEGQQTAEILPDLQQIISDIHFPQTMRWGSESYKYARPIRWLVALLNEEVIPFEIAHVKTGNTTYGHRFLGNEAIINHPLEYEDVLYENYVIADPKKREQLILDQIKEIEKQEKFHIQVETPLLNEVRNLVEYPTAFFGTFAEEYLQLPQETLTTSMAEHQRYFPVMTEADDALLPYFVSVRNGDEQQIDNVVKGNEKVLRARLADGAFFFAEDKKHSIEFYNNKLKTVVFQEKIGTTYEKVENVVALTKKINKHIEINQEVADQAIRTAEISKFDLMTNMVGEFPELQGIMGEKYALHFGEETTVAAGVKEHYYPVQSNGKLPSSDVGAIVSVADKLDTIVGCISVGLVPTGSQDPHGLRRQAIGILRIIKKCRWNITVEELISFACDLYDVSADVKRGIDTFFMNRAAFLLSEHNIEQDVIHAVIDEQIGVFKYSLDRAKLLSEKRNDPSFKNVQEALVRIMNLGKKADHAKVEEALFETESEKMLFNQSKQVAIDFNLYHEQLEATKALEQLEKLADPVHAFFEHNMVMADDEKVKRNRLALVQQIASLIDQFADMTLIEWKQHH